MLYIVIVLRPVVYKPSITLTYLFVYNIQYKMILFLLCSNTIGISYTYFICSIVTMK